MADTKFQPLVIVEQVSTPTTPPGGRQKVYPKTDGKVYALNSAGIETELTNAGAGGLSQISGTETFDFGNEGDFVLKIISNSFLANSNFKSFNFIPVETAQTSLDDFSLNGVGVNLEDIVNNTSFTLRAFALNNASGIYQINYVINY
jgi:hypothetical protein